jgi:iron complex outermembrane recepter protein
MQQHCKYNITFATMLQIRKLIFRYIALLSALLYTGGITAQVVEGVILNSSTGTPVPFAGIYIIELESGTIADSLGVFRLSNFPSSEVTLRVTAPGFTTYSERYTHKQDITLEILLSPIHVHLDEVVVSTPFGRLQNENITNVEMRSLTTMNRIPASNITEALTTIPGVYATTTGPGIGKPVIRGMSGTRVVTYLNGLRIENQQWGDDHGIGVTGIGIENVEVIKGPASLLYGADALGGVLYFTNQSYAKLNRFEAYIDSRFESNTLGTSNELGLKWNCNGLKFNLIAGQSLHADYQLANGNRVFNSRFSNQTVKASLGYNKRNWVSNIHYGYAQNYIGVPGETEEDSLYPELFYTTAVDWNKTWPYQSITNHYLSVENKFIFSKSQLELILGNTNVQLREIEEEYGGTALDLGLNNSLYNLRWKGHLAKNVEGIIGSQGMYQMNENGTGAEEILIPDNTSTDLGIYGLVQLELKKWMFQGGVRVDNREISTLSDFNGFGILHKSYTGYNYSAGFVVKVDSAILRFNLSSGFRAPHTSELLSNGVHPGTFKYIIGDPELKTENATQADFSIHVNYDHIEVTFNPFFNVVNNYIYLTPSDSTIDSYQVFRYTQEGSARLFGGDFSLHTHPHFAHWVHIQSGFSYIYAQDANENPLPLIPQARINSQVKFELPCDGWLSAADIVIQHSYNFEQERIGLFESETPAYNLLHAGINASIRTKGQPLIISIGVKNILNESYMDHLSRLKPLGLSQPGINAYFGIKYSLEKKIRKGK